MPDIAAFLALRQRRKAAKALDGFARQAKKTETSIVATMRALRAMGSQWLAIIEAMERENPAEAARLPVGTKNAAETIVAWSADMELALGDTLAGVLSLCDSITALSEVG